jgi:hypothetical protein
VGIGTVGLLRPLGVHGLQSNQQTAMYSYSIYEFFAGQGAPPPGASRCYANKLATRSFPPRPPGYVLSRRCTGWTRRKRVR